MTRISTSLVRGYCLIIVPCTQFEQLTSTRNARVSARSELAARFVLSLNLSISRRGDSKYSIEIWHLAAFHTVSHDSRRRRRRRRRQVMRRRRSPVDLDWFDSCCD
uniref:(northern house mosquito) hypothetical protein n=1 Tax=Culex pipiens TaxID=7175 RepID=A0A8D8ETP0_CULPI